ncbi:hypothetical protein HY605_00125, partial [Candidatus Peregrinibacteria bacterium]|nr:hypothetical protein [Candidatus Peregrinibacteria bacterium]
SRAIPQKIQKFVKQKSNGHCAFPGCKKGGKILHHTERFSLKKEHNPDTIVLLCVQHERLVHTGLVDESKEPREWRIREFVNERDKRWRVDKVVREYRKIQ